ncbi:MAG TPA: LysR family transcriptional regulator [Casimicrobiaceae bacterium]|nr:LysR family transcriptional regulator [Casimicrobiaceae bacterium]
MESLAGVVAFVRTAQLRSFTGAGRALGLTGSAVAKAVARLEASLGVRLLHRTTRSVTLTDDGAVFLDHAQRALAALDDAASVVGRGNASLRGTLRVDVPVVLGRERIVPALVTWLAAHAQLAVDLRFSDRWTPLIEEGIDVAIRIGAIADSRLVARVVGEQRLAMVASPAYLGRRGTPRRPADLDDHDGIAFRLPTSGRARPWQLQQAGRPVEMRPRGRLLLDEGEALVRAAEAGAGIAQVPDYMAAAAIARGALVPILEAFAPAPLPVSAVYAHAPIVAPKVRAFVDFVVANAPALFAPSVAARAQGARRGKRYMPG